jgi:hypothetical protein
MRRLDRRRGGVCELASGSRFNREALQWNLKSVGGQQSTIATELPATLARRWMSCGSLVRMRSLGISESGSDFPARRVSALPQSWARTRAPSGHETPRQLQRVRGVGSGEGEVSPGEESRDLFYSQQDASLAASFSAR